MIPSDDAPPRSRRRRQFSLRLLLLAMLVLGPVCGWLGPSVIRFVVETITADEAATPANVRTHGGTI